MKRPEQMTIAQFQEQATLADGMLYGGLLAIGVAVGVFLALKYFRGTRDN